MRQMSLRQFAAHLATESAEQLSRQRMGLDAAGKIVRDEARGEIGHYQAAAGPLLFWAPLKFATMQDRASKGYTPNEPLLREGKLRGTIFHRNDSRELLVGSDLDIAEYQEMGTKRIPPRSFLGGAMVRKTDEAMAEVVDAVLGPLKRGRP